MSDRLSKEVEVLEVRRLRNAKGWRQADLAYRAGLAPSVVSEIENGKRDPGAGTLRKLATALEVEVAELFGPKTQPPLFAQAERVRLGDVASDRQIAALDDELRRLYRVRGDETKDPERAAAVVDAINAFLADAERASTEAG